jgi:hypothetical protein
VTSNKPKRTPVRLSPEQIRLRSDEPLTRSTTAATIQSSDSPHEQDPWTITEPTAQDNQVPVDEVNAADEATGEDAYGATSAPATKPESPAEITSWVFSKPVTDNDARRAALQDIEPAGPLYEVAAVKDVVIDLMLSRVPFVSAASDRQVLQVNVQFARWCRNNSPDGTFTPERDYRESRIADFLRHGIPAANGRTKQTYASNVRRLAGPRRRPNKEERVQAQPPYKPAERDRMWADACNRDDWLGIEMRTLLSLTFGAGCRGEEVHTFTASQVERLAGRVMLTVVNGHWVREVPVYGAHALWLEGRAKNLSPDDHLFRPGFKTRRNATSKTIELIAKTTNAFEGWKSTRARHTWLCDLLSNPIPVAAICQVAGISRNSNLITDMAPYLPSLPPREVLNLFDRALAPKEDHNPS